MTFRGSVWKKGRAERSAAHPAPLGASLCMAATPFFPSRAAAHLDAAAAAASAAYSPQLHSIPHHPSVVSRVASHQTAAPSKKKAAAPAS